MYIPLFHAFHNFAVAPEVFEELRDAHAARLHGVHGTLLRENDATRGHTEDLRCVLGDCNELDMWGLKNLRIET